MDVGSFISEVTGDNSPSNSILATNESERDGNSDDVLFRMSDQGSLTIAGGTTVTSFSLPQALQDLSNGLITKASLFWLVVVALVGWFLLKKAS